MRRAPTSGFFRNYLFYACCVLILLSTISFSYAWLFKDVSHLHSFVTTNVAFTANVYYEQDDGSTVPASRYEDAQTGCYLVNIADSTAANYAPRLRIDLTYQGVTRSYLRVFLSEMWAGQNTSSGSGTSPGTLTALLKADTDYLTPAGQWTDNRLHDDCYYYTGGTGGDESVVYNETPGVTETIPFITGIDNFVPMDDGQMLLQVRAETVQVNRLAAFWDTARLPAGFPAVPVSQASSSQDSSAGGASSASGS